MANPLRLLACLAVAAALPSHASDNIERDGKYRFSVKRPATWINQDPPFPTTRVMLGLEGHNYVGNCNVVVTEVPASATLSQATVDASVNKWERTPEEFLPVLRVAFADTKVLNVEAVERGGHSGALANYTYSYMSKAAGKRMFGRAELFSHSRPGLNFSFTCMTVAASTAEASAAFQKEAASFRRFSSSLQVQK
jgi:hypothetical protein